MKELVITPPVGYEIDKEKSTFEKIVFKPIDTKPRNWEEYCKNTSIDGKYIIRIDSSVSRITGYDNENLKPEYDKNFLPSKELAEAFLAMMQLMSLRQAWIGDWEPDWKNKNETKYCLCQSENIIKVYDFCTASRVLSFPTLEMAKEFLNCFKDLLETAKILL